MTVQINQQEQAQIFITKIEAQLDSMVSEADADTLFTSGYLRGHIMLAAGYLEMEEKLNIEQLIENTNQSLQQAIEAGELNDKDKALVNSLWADLQQLKA